MDQAFKYYLEKYGRLRLLCALQHSGRYDEIDRKTDILTMLPIRNFGTKCLNQFNDLQKEFNQKISLIRGKHNEPLHNDIRG